MPTKGKARVPKKSRPKQARVKARKGKSKSAERPAIAASKRADKSAKRGGTTVIVIPSGSSKYRVYGAKRGRIRAIGSKATASGIAGRLGVNRDIFREVDRVLEHLRLRKKIG